MYTAYADESGKTDNFLVVGAVWFLNGPEIIEVTQEVERLAKARGISAELHFREIDYSTLDFYKEVAALVLARSATISFTSISVERRGHKRVDDAIANLYEHLLLRGVEYHDSTNRAPLPRSLSVFKDREEVGRDKLLMANLEESLRQASEARLEGKLYVDRLAAVDSEENIPVQLGDLYTSSVARVLNATGKRNSARDDFADFFLGELGIPNGPAAEERVGDMVAHVAL